MIDENPISRSSSENGALIVPSWQPSPSALLRVLLARSMSHAQPTAITTMKEALISTHLEPALSAEITRLATYLASRAAALGEQRVIPFQGDREPILRQALSALSAMPAVQAERFLLYATDTLMQLRTLRTPMAFFGLDPRHCYTWTAKIAEGEVQSILFVNTIIAGSITFVQLTEFFMVDGAFYGYGSTGRLPPDGRLAVGFYPFAPADVPHVARLQRSGLARELYLARLKTLRRLNLSGQFIVQPVQFQIDEFERCPLIFYLKLGFVPANSALSASAAELLQQAKTGRRIPLAPLRELVAALTPDGLILPD